MTSGDLGSTSALGGALRSNALRLADLVDELSPTLRAAEVGRPDHAASERELLGSTADELDRVGALLQQWTATTVESLTRLRELDHRYRLHLQSMRNLRDQVGLHAHGQRDPKQIYKKEGFDLYLSSQAETNANVAKYLSRVVVKSEQAVRDAEALTSSREDGPRMIDPAPQESMEAVARRAMAAAMNAQARSGLPTAASQALVPKLGRNEPCWCGRGKKYKHCHLRLDETGTTDPEDVANATPAADAAKII